MFESPALTATRELEEETGYKIKVNEAKVRIKEMTWSYEDKNTHVVLIAYRAEPIGGVEKNHDHGVADIC